MMTSTFLDQKKQSDVNVSHRTAMLIAVIVATLFGVVPALALDKPRIVVLSDIGAGDPDDEQSFVRFLVYANEFDIEGLIATATPRFGVNAEAFRERIEAYREVLGNLRVHAEGYPDADALLALIKDGAAERNMTSVGNGKTTEGSDAIIEVIDRPDPRPVWVTVWGAPTDLAQALWDVRRVRSPAEVDRFVRKLRIYDIAGQDDSGGWICHAFPEIHWLRSVDQFQAISVRAARPFPPEYVGANLDTFTTAWVHEHIMSHGPLGALYPERKWKYEGDTPAFLYLIRNGLSDPEHQEHGGWGGRFGRERTKNPNAFGAKRTEMEKKYRPFAMYTEAEDTWRYRDIVYHNNRHAAWFRWREPVQHDFAARMDWSVTPKYDDANHNPVAVFHGEAGHDIVYLQAGPGETVRLDATGSTDPDGDGIRYEWFSYPEPGTYRGEVAIREPWSQDT
ncbi:MAG: nucleoside hydrolase-like domain-containing protein, partial [Planctomycetota bacterium]